MLFKEFGGKALPTIILLHGGGLSWWSLQKIIDGLQENYYVVTPVIDGHGEDGAEAFISIEDSAQKLIRYIDDICGGHVYAIGGLSIGAQIVVEALSVRSDIAKYAVIESALVLPIKGISALTVPTYKLFYGLIKKKWFAKLQARTLFVTNTQFDMYYEDSLKLSRESLINITISNGNYRLKETIRNTKAKVLIIAGGKERAIMKKSAEELREKIPCSQLHIAKNKGHGELSLVHPAKYLQIINDFFAK